MNRNRFARPDAISAHEIARRCGVELGLCPFCHGGNLAIWCADTSAHVECFGCGASGPVVRATDVLYGDVLVGAVMKWNDRKPRELPIKRERP